MTLNDEDLSYSVLTVQNPAGNSTALTVTPLAVGTRPISAHLVITQIGLYIINFARSFMSYCKSFFVTR